jgi:hypothetical protein
MVEWAVDRIASWDRPTYHIVVKMVTDNPTKMSNRIDRFRKNLNRQAFGSYWHKHDDHDLTVGIRIFEKAGDYIHAHVLLAPPPSFDPQALMRTTKHLFGGIEPTIQETIDDLGNRCWIARTAAHGEIWMQEVRPTDADRRRIIDYCLKELDFKLDQHQNIEQQWRVIERS